MNTPITFEDVTVVCDWNTSECKIIAPLAYRAEVEKAWPTKPRGDDLPRASFSGPIYLEWEPAQPVMPERTPTPEQKQKVREALERVGEWPINATAVRTPNASKGLVACSCGECDTVRCESTKKVCTIRESQIPTVWPINARAIRPDQRFISAVDGIPNGDYVDIVVSGDTVMDDARYAARALRRNELHTAGANAEFTGDAVLSSGCGYCTNHELVLNGRSLTDIVAFLQDQNSACTEPFEVSIQVRAKPRKD